MTVPVECARSPRRRNKAGGGERPRRGALAIGVGVFLACSPNDGVSNHDTPPWDGGPVVRPVFSVPLVQTDSAQLTVPISLALDRASGDFLVSDGRDAQVLRYGRDGRATHVYGGSRYAGILNTWTVAGTDGRVYVVDLTHSRVNVFDDSTASLQDSLPLRGSVGVALADPTPDLWIGLHYRGVSPEHPNGAAFWRPRDDRLVPLRLPAEYFRFPALSVHSGLNVVARADDFVASFAALEPLLRVGGEGEVLDTVFVPIRSRRGVRHNVLLKAGMDQAEVVNHASRTVLMDRTIEGELVVIHQDAEVLSSGRLRVKMTVSLVSPLLDRACVDGGVPIESFQAPNPYFRQDTLWVQSDGVDQGEPWVRVTAFEIDRTTCRWLPTKRATGMVLE